MNSVRVNNLSLKNQRFRISGYKDIGIRKWKFVTNPQFLASLILCLIIYPSLFIDYKPLKNNAFRSWSIFYHFKIMTF